MTSFTIEYSLIFNLKSFISSIVLYKSNFCVVNIHVPTKLQNWKSAEYRRCPSWYISRYISSFEHWFPKNVVTFLTKISEDYRPDHVHPVITPKSEVSFTCALPKMLHSILVAVFFTYNATSRVFLCFFYENFHHFYFLKFLENRSLKEFLPGFNEGSPESWQYRQELSWLWFARFLFSSYVSRWWQKKPNLFFF